MTAGARFGWMALMIVMVAAIALILTLRQAGDPSGSVDTAKNAEKVEDGCVLTQTLAYTRCAHEVTRRVEAPTSLTGKTREEAQAAYPDWQLTEFLPARIAMRRDIALHCPEHYVLMPDEAGMLGVFRNEYGDGLKFLRGLETPLSALPEDVAQSVREGMGFDSLEALEGYLESLES